MMRRRARVCTGKKTCLSSLILLTNTSEFIAYDNHDSILHSYKGENIMDMQDLLYMGAMEQERSSNAIERFNDRWERLGNIQTDIAEKFVDEVLGKLSGKDHDELMPHIEEVLTWQKNINDNLARVEDKHLSEYAKHLKNTAMLAIGLCKKYKVYDDIKALKYIEKHQMLKLNGDDFYFFG